MVRWITSLPALECFRAAAEQENFSKAADRLNLTHGAVSRAVRLLEQDLGVALFTRRNRAVFLTDEGKRLAAAVAQGLGHIEEAFRDIKAAHADAPITVSCEPTLMMRWLIPRMPQLNGLADVRLLAGGGPVTLGDGIDLAIRREDFDLPQAYRAEPLFDEWVGPVCRPDLRERFFEGQHLRRDAPLLHSRTRMRAWPDWAVLHDQDLGGHPERLFEHFYFSLQAAVAGLGVAIGPWHLVRDDLEAGLLAAPTGFSQDGSRYLLLSCQRSGPRSAELAFRDWLIKLATEESGPPLSL